MGIVYHGSPVVGLKTLTPHQSTHGNYVYATKEKLVALILSGKYGDDMTFSLFRNGHDDPWKLVERIPNGFATMFNNSSSIYTLNDDSFKDIQTGFSEEVEEKDTSTVENPKTGTFIGLGIGLLSLIILTIAFINKNKKKMYKI